jgi:hypothetical protein
MSVWSLKKQEFFVRGSPIQIAVDGEPEARKKKTRCQVLVCARQPPQNTGAIACGFLRQNCFALSAIADNAGRTVAA